MSDIKLRVFIAIPLPADLKAHLAELHRPIPGLKWYTDLTLHLTLRFIGSIEGVRVPVIREYLAQVRVPGFDMRLKGLGLFERPRRVVLWVGLDKSQMLEQLKHSIDLALQQAGLPLDDQPYRPHITLGRADEGARAALNALVDSNQTFSLEWRNINQFILYQSELCPGGAQHRPLAVYQ